MTWEVVGKGCSFETELGAETKIGDGRSCVEGEDMICISTSNSTSSQVKLLKFSFTCEKIFMNENLFS